MSSIYNLLESEIQELESIENWNDKIVKMKEIKEKITVEQQKLNEMINMLLKNEPVSLIQTQSKPDQDTKKKKKQDLETLVQKFKEADTIEEKIKLYNLISYHINEVESQLFSTE